MSELTEEHLFRSQDASRGELAAALQSPILQRAIGLLLGSISNDSVPEDAPEIVSVRKLAFRGGYEKFVRDLSALTRPMPTFPAESIPSYGADKEAEALAKAWAGPK